MSLLLPELNTPPRITAPRESTRGREDRPESQPQGPNGGAWRQIPPALPAMPVGWVGVEGLLKALVLLAAAGILAWTFSRGGFWRFHQLAWDESLGLSLWGAAMSYGGVVFASLVWRIVLWRRYRPMEAVGDEALPSVTIVIPAFNEG